MIFDAFVRTLLPSASCRSRFRALRVQRATERVEDPDILLMSGGRAFYLGRRVMKSLFGAVFHGVQGVCPDPNK